MYKSLFIIGIEGNMGRRYSAVARYLGINYSGCDYHSSRLERIPPEGALILIATPTENHLSDCLYYLHKDSHDVLCEKPIVKNSADLERLKGINLNRLFMVNNYCYVDTKRWNSIGKVTLYNYFMSGKDGLIFDCIQLFGLAGSDEEIILENSSPIWRCAINGFHVDRDSIDESYVKMIADFFGEKKQVWNGEKIIDVHQKVLNYIENTK